MKAMEKPGKIKLFVYNLVYDVCEYFLQTIYHKVKGYLVPRAELFSENGYNALFRFLREGSGTFYSELLQNKSFRRLNEISYLLVSRTIIEESKWMQLGGHSEFFELCGKLAILRVFCEDIGFSTELIYEQLVKLAVEAVELGILNPDYDRIRNFGVEIVCVVFKWQNMTLADFAKDKVIDYEEIDAPNHLVVYLERSGRELLNAFEANESLTRMNIDKFKVILQLFSSTYRNSIKSGDEYVEVCELAIYIALLGAHCAKVGYKEGVDMALDAICQELIDFFKRPTSQTVKLS